MEETAPNRKKKKKRPARRRFAEWKTGDYFKQLSVVIIGILVTFSGSSLIGRIETRRQIRQTAQLLHAELKGNLVQLDAMYDFTTNDCTAYETFVGNYIRDIYRISSDSVLFFHSVLSHCRTFRYKKNALETMKNSAAVQDIRDREIVLDIFDCYDKLDLTFGWCNNLYDHKSDAVLEFFHSLDKPTIESLFDRADAYKVLAAMIADKAMYNYIRNNSTQMRNLIRNCQDARESVSATIALLEREFGITAETGPGTD